MAHLLLGALGLVALIWCSPTRAEPVAEPATLVADLATADAYESLVQLGDRAVNALADAGCTESEPIRGRSVLALQEIGSARAQAALRDVARCAIGAHPDIRRWAVLAAAAITEHPATLFVLMDDHHDAPELLDELSERAVALWKAERLMTAHWLVAPGGRTRWADALVVRHPHIVPVRELAWVVASHPEAARRTIAANVLLAMPPGHAPLVADALVLAHRFDPAAAAPPWTGRPEIARFDLPRPHQRALARELIAWLVSARSPLDSDLAAVAWNNVPPVVQRLGTPRTKADWLHLWGGFDDLDTIAARLTVPVMPGELSIAWQAEAAFQDAARRRRIWGLAEAAISPSAILRRRAISALDGIRRPGPRAALRHAYYTLWSALDEGSGPRAYADVASIVAEGREHVRWPDISPLGHQLVERHLRADRFDERSAAAAYEDGLLALHDAYDPDGTIPRCCGDGWLYWIGRLDGRATVRRRLRHLGMHRLPHYATLVTNQPR